MTSHDLVTRFLTSIGHSDEADFYLKLFKNERPERFAIIVAGSSTIQETPEVLITDLRFLAQLKLTPVVVFGILHPTKSLQSLKTIYNQLHAHAKCKIVDATDLHQVQALTQNNGIPLVSFPKEASTINDRFDILAILAKFLCSRKIMFLGTRSGLQNRDGTIVSLVNMANQYEKLLAPDQLPPHQQALLRQINRIFQTIDRKTTIAITSPLDLLRELFTSTGAGTLIRAGSSVEKVESMSHVDHLRVQTLIETAFGNTLINDFFSRPIAALYLADDYRGTAIITNTPVGFYLTKFAVDREARGEGVGHDLWWALQQDYPRLFWRSHANNPFVSWYEKQCDGLIRKNSWYIFWKGIASPDIENVIDYACQAPIDFKS